MKVQDLKKIIKPLIKECLKEVLVEEGFVKMIQESVQIQPTKLAPVSTPQNIKPQQPTQNLQEAKKKMLDAIGSTGFDAFAGTQPLKEDLSVKGSDPGIDISELMGNKDVWKQTLNAMNKKK